MVNGQKENFAFWLKVVLLWIAFIVFFALMAIFLCRKAGKADPDEVVEMDPGEVVEKFIESNDGVNNGLRIVSVCKDNRAMLSSDLFEVKLICNGINETDTFEVVYNSDNPESDIESPSVSCTCEWCMSRGKFNPSAVTGRQLMEGCLFSLKDCQSAVIVGFPDNASYRLIDLTGTEHYARKAINLDATISAESALDTGEIVGVYNAEEGVETVGFMRVLGNTPTVAEVLLIAFIAFFILLAGFAFFLSSYIIIVNIEERRLERKR